MKKKVEAPIDGVTKKKLLFVGAEAMPFAATGGLGDVMGSLPAALAATGRVDVRVVMPLYSSVSDAWRRQMKQEYVTTVRLSWREQYCAVFSLEKDGVSTVVYFEAINKMLKVMKFYNSKATVVTTMRY